ncbi:Exocyst complex subunit [Phaffia rhodozyma]|uniref:Exocyst complex component EXO84 n=1 Tax=Phaffia rhodozyma TaxID=264483 RepID=A0A0F7SLP6_PHARH|nr:Exocyst complex subunit [Phaffia rhodozyma]
MSRMLGKDPNGPSTGFPLSASSLRTRRPSNVTNGLSKKPPKSDSSGTDGKSHNRKSKAVSDKIKRRLSMRYADITSSILNTNSNGPVPSVPSIHQRQNHQPHRPTPQGAIVRRKPSMAEITDNWGQHQETDDLGRSTFPLAQIGQTAEGEEESDVLDRFDLLGRTNEMRKDPGTLDIGLISQQGFDPQAYIKTKLAGATPEEIGAFATALEASKAATSKDLQRNVFKNYAEFVTISKEIATLENDMLELKELLSEWKGVPEALGSIGDSESQTRRPNNSGLSVLSSTNNRSSIADLQSLYRQQLHTLYTTVSGSQKFVPIVPGRHIVAEAASFVELNPATYKLKGAVRIFLLNDLILIAGIKKRRIGGTEGSLNGKTTDKKSKSKDSTEDSREGRLVAERCWVLAEVTVVDVKDSGNLTNAIKIRRGKETLIFRTDQTEEKRSLLVSFRQVAETLASKKRKEIEKEQVKRKSLWQGDMASQLDGSTSSVRSFYNIPAVPSLPGSRTSILDLGPRGSSTDGSGKDMHWVDEFGDELAVAIALQEWETAVSLVEKGRLHLATLSSPIDPLPSLILRQKFIPLQNALFTSLTHKLASSSLRKTSLATLVSYFYRLDQPDLARSTFLAARTDLIKKRIGQIRWEGDSVVYVNELAVVCFMGVKNTTEWYLNAFRENGMASALIKWAKEQVEAFASMFKQQIFSEELDQTVLDQSFGPNADPPLYLSRSTAEKLLHDIGLDLTFLLQDILIAPRSASSHTESKETLLATSPTSNTEPNSTSNSTLNSNPRQRPASIVPLASTTSGLSLTAVTLRSGSTDKQSTTIVGNDSGRDRERDREDRKSEKEKAGQGDDREESALGAILEDEGFA